MSFFFFFFDNPNEAQHWNASDNVNWSAVYNIDVYQHSAQDKHIQD